MTDQFSRTSDFNAKLS